MSARRNAPMGPVRRIGQLIAVAHGDVLGFYDSDGILLGTYEVGSGTMDYAERTLLADRVRRPTNAERREIENALHPQRSATRTPDELLAFVGAGSYGQESAGPMYGPGGSRNPEGPRSRFRHERVESPRDFDPRSFRTIHSGGVELTIGCPAGEYKRGRCRVGTRVQRVLKPNPLLAINALAGNPGGRRATRFGTACYAVIYQNVVDGEPAVPPRVRYDERAGVVRIEGGDPKHPCRVHVYEQPDNVTLWELSPYQVLLQGEHAPLAGKVSV